MSRLALLRRKLRKRRRQRIRQSHLWQRTRKRGHALAATRHARAVRFLRSLIRKEATARIVSRSEWGAAPPRGGYVRQGTLIAGVQHHTAMPTLSADAPFEEECARMRQLQAIHQGQGWTDIGYALVVMPSGRIYEGRPAWAVGAHTLGHNTGYAGWSLDGNYETDKPTSEAIAGCRRAREALGVTGKPLYGHRDLNPTACPGRHLYPHLNKEI